MGGQSTAVALRPTSAGQTYVGPLKARMSVKIRDLTHVKSALERWACRRYGGSIGDMSMTGKLMSGVRDNVCTLWLDDIAARKAHDPFCPLCQGRGRVRLDEAKRRRVSKCSICDPKGQFMGQICFRCGGKKSYVTYDILVNPAVIRGTGSMYTDVVCHIVDNLVGSWRESDATVWLHRVIVNEYCWNGTQVIKARRLRVSLSFYEKRLHEGHAAVERELDAKLSQSVPA